MSLNLVMIFLLLILDPTNGARASSSYEGKHHLVNGCKIHSLSGIQIKRIPGHYCQFLDNGDFLSMTVNTLKYIRSNGAVKWSLDGKHFHHQLNLSEDRQRVLTMASVEKEIKGIRYRVDQFFVYDINDGKVLFQADADQIIESSGVNPTTYKGGFPANIFSASDEYSHFNSFYEIPAFTPTRATHPAIRKGNYIINSIGLGVMVLDSNLKKVLFHKQFRQSYNHNVHDVQVTGRGTLIAFVNVAAANDMLHYSSVIELDPLTTSTIFEFKADPPSMFLSLHCGSVQDLGKGLILFSHHYAGVYIYNTNTRKMVFSNQKLFIDVDRVIPAQQIKIENLDLFLKKNHDAVF